VNDTESAAMSRCTLVIPYPWPSWCIARGLIEHSWYPVIEKVLSFQPGHQLLLRRSGLVVVVDRIEGLADSMQVEQDLRRRRLDQAVGGEPNRVGF
jgi:hypothetical protein